MSDRRSLSVLVVALAIVAALLTWAVLGRGTVAASPHSEIVAASHGANRTLVAELAPGVPGPTPPKRQVSVEWNRPLAPVAVGDNTVWVATTSGFAAVDPVTLTTRNVVATPLPVVALAWSPDGIWVVIGSDKTCCPADNPPYTLMRVNTTTFAVEYSTELPGTVGYHSSWHLRLVASPGTAWVAFGPEILRFHVTTGAVTTIPLGGSGAGNIAADASGLWVATSGGDTPESSRPKVLRIDLATNAITTVPGIQNGFSWSIASSGDAAWLVEVYTEPEDSRITDLHLLRIDAATLAITSSRVKAIAVVAENGEVWIQVAITSVIGKVDPQTLKIVRTLPIALNDVVASASDGYNNPPFAIADGQIWSAFGGGLQRTSGGLQRTTP